MKLQLVVAVCMLLICLPLAQSADTAAVLLQHAREVLVGEHKNTELAKKLLLEAVEKGGLDPDSLCYAYVYLGYVDDRAKNREAALAWFTQAAAVEGAHSGLGLARAGLQSPLTRIRHLDETQPAESAVLLVQHAREALMGEHKNLEQAKELLLKAVEKGLDPNWLCSAYLYLGYIEDRTQNREAAVAWFTKASAVPDGPACVRSARSGLQMPVTSLPEFDQVASAHAPSKPPVKIMEIGKGYVGTSPPTGLSPATTLSTKERQENFDILWEAIDKTYATFNLKSIDWPGVRQRYQKRLGSVRSTADFYLLLFQLVNELKDTHSWLQNYNIDPSPYGPGLSIDLFQGKPFVVAVNPGTEAATAGVAAGWEILAVDGSTVEEKMEQLRPYLHACSSERAYKRAAARYLLTGDKETIVTVKLRAPEGPTKTLTLLRDAGLGRHSVARSQALELTRQHFVHFGRHQSGLGYIRIESFNGREEIADEFDRALEALKDTPGLILDIRDNQGGLGSAQARIVGRFISEPTVVAISHIKNGPNHDDLRRTEARLGPTGQWQYKGPVALLLNDVTGSAADLFACYMRSTGRVVTIGSTTHGNLSGWAVYAVLPCGLVVRISNAYVSDAKDRPIELNGNQPDVAVSPDISDFLEQRDPVLDKAVALLRERSAAGKSAATGPSQRP